MSRVLKASFVYFALVLAAGFVLGAPRVLWAVPHLGERLAELVEMPLMLVVIFFAAQWTVRHFDVPASIARRLGIGVLALACLVAAELGLVLALRGLTIGDYVAGRDPVSGIVYLVMLGVFAVMPLLVARG